MKRITTAALALAMCGSVYAQSNVTIFGTVDLYFNSAKSGLTNLTRLKDGGNAASRFGFRGSEDLGGGLRANFLLEAGFAPDTGAGTLPGPGLSFTRQSMVGLSGPWGAVDMGRMYTPMFYALYRADSFGVNANFSPLNLVAATDAQAGLRPFSARASNMLRYRAPAGKPFVLDIAFAPGEAASPNQRNGDLYGATVGWNSKALYIAYAFQKTRSGSTTAPVAAPNSSTYQSVNAAYNVTPALRASANYIRNSLSLATTPKSDIVNIGLEWGVTPVSRVLASVARRKVDGTPRGQLAWTLGYDYYLSKRTTLYARWLQLDNRASASATLAGVPVVLNSGDGVRSLGLGVRHNF